MLLLLTCLVSGLGAQTGPDIQTPVNTDPGWGDSPWIYVILVVILLGGWLVLRRGGRPPRRR